MNLYLLRNLIKLIVEDVTLSSSAPKSGEKITLHSKNNNEEGALTREDLKDTEDPLDWIEAARLSPEEFLSGEASESSAEGLSFPAMIEIAKERGLIRLGKGSSRVVFALDDENVVKIALNSSGISQNRVETTAGKDPQVDSILAGVVQHSSDFSWIVAERGTPLKTEKEFEEISGLSWKEFLHAFGRKLDKVFTDVTQKQKEEISGEEKRKVSSSCLTKKDLINQVLTFLKRYQKIMVSDLTKVDSWGTNKEGCLILLDYGITEKEFKEKYSGGRYVGSKR